MSMYCWNVSSLCMKQYITNQKQTWKLKKCTINYITTIKLLNCFLCNWPKGAIKEWLHLFNPRKEREIKKERKNKWNNCKQNHKITGIQMYQQSIKQSKQRNEQE